MRDLTVRNPAKKTATLYTYCRRCGMTTKRER